VTPDEHRAAVEAWRADRRERLLRADGWLTLVGLWWLQPGINRVGSDPGGEVVLPSGPSHVASIEVGERVTLHPTPGSGLRSGALELHDDLDGEPTVVELGSLRFHLIRRGERLAVRVRDHDAPARAEFEGLDHHPTDLAWRVTARLEPAGDRLIRVPDVLGDVNEERCAGRLHFELDGRACSLDALPGGEDGSLWLIFSDLTNEDDTYPAGRFVYSEPPADGSVIVDFNLAYNPPCAFTPYATCPLPPEGNRLDLRVEAGELAYRPHP
jgi:uncharacterized protein